MTRIVIKRLIFDQYNLAHIKKHRVTQEEALEVGRSFFYHRKTHTGRYLAIGRMGTRIITLIIKRETPGKYYLITARDSSKKERKRLYAKEKQNP